jgi:hypothetical protein
MNFYLPLRQLGLELTGRGNSQMEAMYNLNNEHPRIDPMIG